jgi:uncharacterized protein YbjQ (UPF0145 family)
MIIESQVVEIPDRMTSTSFEIAGFRTVENKGVVRGVVVRSRSVLGTLGAGLQTVFGGNISLFTELAERTRQQAFGTMLIHAHLAGANAVVGVRYDANELMQGVTEVLCYGTAVTVVPGQG